MTRLTKTKARELVTRELGAAASRLVKPDQSATHNPANPWYTTKLGALTVDVRTTEAGEVTQLQLHYGDAYLSTHFYTDTLEPFCEYDDMVKSQMDDDRMDTATDFTRRLEADVREALIKHYHADELKRITGGL